MDNSKLPSWNHYEALQPENPPAFDISATSECSDSCKLPAVESDRDTKNSIHYRTCSWPKTAALLFSEYICLAIMSFPHSYSVLGIVPGILITVIVACLVQYTSLIVWRYCLKNPEVKDICDIGRLLFWNKSWAWYFTAVMFILNNTFVQGFHCLVGSKYLSTIIEKKTCAIAFSALVAFISFICSLPRTFSAMAKVALGSAFFTFISVVLATIFSVIEKKHPMGYPDKGPIQVHLFLPSGTTFVAAINAVMNISYTFIGQITIPSFIAEMRNPHDFPKALWAVTIFEVLLFSAVGAIIYAYTGSNYITAPAFGSLNHEVFKKVSFSFMVPTIVFVGVLYAAISARFIIFNIFKNSRHINQHTLTGWLSWIGILGLTWVCAFFISQVIPFFSDLLALMSSVFDSFFGFIYWGVAAYHLSLYDCPSGSNSLPSKNTSLSIFRRNASGITKCAFLCLVGVLFLTVGTYASITSIIEGFRASAVERPFTCNVDGI